MYKMISYDRDDMIKIMDAKIEIKRLKRETSERTTQREKEENTVKEREFKKWLASRPEVVRHAETIFAWAENIFNDEELMPRWKEFYDFFTIYQIGSYRVQFSPKHKSLFLTEKYKYGEDSQKLSTPEEMVRKLDKVFISQLYNRVISGEVWNSIYTEIENY